MPGHTTKLFNPSGAKMFDRNISMSLTPQPSCNPTYELAEGSMNTTLSLVTYCKVEKATQCKAISWYTSNQNSRDPACFQFIDP